MRYVLVLTAFMLAGCTTGPRPAPYADIEAAYEARLEMLLAKVDRGEITPKEARALALQYEAEANTAVELRRAARAQRRY